MAGRLLQTDPVGYKDDVNWYVYVGNDPVNHADLTGLESASEALGQNPLPTRPGTVEDRAAGDLAMTVVFAPV